MKHAAQRARTFLELWCGDNTPTCSYLTHISAGPGSVTFKISVAVRGTDSNPARLGHTLYVHCEHADYLAAQLKHGLLDQVAEKLTEIKLNSNITTTKNKARHSPLAGELRSAARDAAVSAGAELPHQSCLHRHWGKSYHKSEVSG